MEQKQQRGQLNIRCLPAALFIALCAGVYAFHAWSLRNEELPLLIGAVFLLNARLLPRMPRIRVSRWIFSLVLSFALPFSFCIGRIAWTEDGHFLTGNNLLVVLTAVPECFLVLVCLSDWLSDLSIPTGHAARLRSRRVSLVFSVVLFLCWLPALICNYPGITIQDYNWQFAQAQGKITSNQHPVLHTLLIRLCQKLSGAIFFRGQSAGLQNTGAVLCNSLIQMVFLALVIGAVLWFFYQRNQVAALIALLFFGLFPMFQIFSVYMTKDVIFSGLVFLFSFELYLLFHRDPESEQKISWKRTVLFLGTAVLTTLFRGNGGAVVVGSCVLLLLLFRKERKAVRRLLFSAAVLCCMVMALQTPVLHLFDIEPSATVESIGVPINQVSRVVVNHAEDLGDEERETIEAVMPLSSIQELYSRRYADPVKMSSDFNRQVLDENRGTYLRLWIRLFFEYPRDYVEAWLDLTIGFWYPGVEKGCISYNFTDRESYYQAFDMNYSTSTAYEHFITEDVRKNPPEAWLWSPGLAVMAMWFLCLLSFWRQGRREVVVYIPSVLAWGTLMLATPSYCETRYIYYVFLCLPMWILIQVRQKTSGKFESWIK